MKVAITGATGMVGTTLQEVLRQSSYEVLPMTRRESSGDEVHWSPDKGVIEADKLEGVDAVVHLAGENIGEGRWNADKKRRIRDSRVHGTELLCSTLAKLEQKPKVLVAASAIGFYGNRSAESLDESSPVGSGFLADVCREWEEATKPAEDAGIRVVRMRIGMILSRKGGALQKMLLPFQLGAGGRVGRGDQYWSWVSLQDVTLAIKYAIENSELSGAVNLVSPNPLTNNEFTKVLGKALGRPTVIPMPALAARMALGEMAEELLLSSTRVYPKKLQDAGFTFAYADLADALKFHLNN